AHPALLPQLTRDTFPDAIRRPQGRECRAGSADLLEVCRERATGVAGIEVRLQLGTPDRAERALDQVLDRFVVVAAEHTRQPRPGVIAGACLPAAPVTSIVPCAPAIST